MKPPSGQAPGTPPARAKSRAGQICVEALHQVGRILMLLVSLVLLAICALGFRLSRGPLQIPHLASQLATAASGQGISVTIGEADLAWAGYHQGGGVPFYLQLGDISVRNEVAVELVHIPEARLEASLASLFGDGEPVRLSGTGARFSGSAVPVSVRAAINMGAGFKLARAEMSVALGAGRLGAGASSVPIVGGGFDLLWSPGAAVLSNGVLLLAPAGTSTPHVGFSGSARLKHDWEAQVSITGDAVRAQDLPEYWPVDAVPNTRNWVTRNITAGVAGQAQFTFMLAAPKNLASIQLTGVSGQFDGQNLTLSWLPHAAPITGLNGRMVFLDEDHAVVSASAGQVGGLQLSAGQLEITGISKKDQTGVLSLRLQGSVPDVVAVLNAPPLSLLSKAPPGLAQAKGNVDGVVKATIPFELNLQFEQVTLDVQAALRDVALASGVPGLEFTQGDGVLQANGQMLDVKGHAQFAGAPATIAVHEIFQGNMLHVAMSTATSPAQLHQLGLDQRSMLLNPVAARIPYQVTIDGAANGTQNAVMTADLTPALLAAPNFGWSKPAGVAGQLKIEAIMVQKNNTAVPKSMSIVAPGLDIAGQMQGDDFIFSDLAIGETRASGMLRQPSRNNPAWSAAFQGTVLDVHAIVNSAQGAVAQAPAKTLAKPAQAAAANAPPTGPLWQVRLNFHELQLSPHPAPPLRQFSFVGNGQGGTLQQEQGSALQASGSVVSLDISPLPGGRQSLALRSADAGNLVDAFGMPGRLQGGTLSLDAEYGGGAPAKGKLVMEKFHVLKAPAFTRVMQEITIYGIAEAASGPGLEFTRAIVPFTWQNQVLQLQSARAYSPSLGFTASGSIDLAGGRLDLDTTLVPAYAINTLPSKIPLLGKLFSAEKGGGLFAARVKISGTLSAPKVSINPLSVLTPGFLRGVFGLGEAPRK